MQRDSIGSSVKFGRFELDHRRQTLLLDNGVAKLQSRAVELLEYLILRRERVVTREEILAHVWRGRAVSENNLTVQMCALRRALAAHGAANVIVTYTGQGYRFVGEVFETATRPAPVNRPADPFHYVDRRVPFGMPL